MSYFFLILFSTIILSFLPERLLKPHTPKLSLSNFFQQALIISFLFLGITLIVQRPVFSGITVLVFLIIMLGISNTKFTALREPMVFSDFAMFSQAFKHPRLYFPFLGLAPVIIAPVLIISLITLVLTLESALPFLWQRVLSTLTALVVIYLMSKKVALSKNLTKEPQRDNTQLGLLNALTSYFFQAKTDAHQQAIKQTLSSSFFSQISSRKDPAKKLKQPNITVIQSESFFDARRLHPSIKSNILNNFDECNKESLQFGKLKVPAWGANTMRTEFSFLTGLAYKDMGFYRYYPYQYLSKMPVNSIASALHAQGYYCVCIHPHPASFFGRDQIFPKMGFNEFIEADSFNPENTFGPYISDEAVTRKVLEVTQQKTDKPLFIFVITMENHGPLHLEKITKNEHAEFFNNDNNKSLKHLDELAIYLRHLKNADEMIKTLKQKYAVANQETLLCFYGDHIPSMPKTYQISDYQDDYSDYFIWNNKHLKNPKNNNQKAQTISIENLAQLLLPNTS